MAPGRMSDIPTSEGAPRPDAPALPPLRTGQRVAVCALLALALALRVVTVVTLEPKPMFYEPQVDAAVYDDWGREIASGNVLGHDVFYMDPLYAYFLGAYYAVRGHDLYGVRLVQVVLGTSGCLALFLAARRLLGIGAAFVALVLSATYQPLVFYDTALTKDFLGAALMSWAIFGVSVGVASGGSGVWLGTGVLLGLLGLVRGNALLLLAALTVGLVVVERRRALPQCAALALGAALAILPATVRNYWVARDLVLTTAQLGPNMYTGNHPGNETGRYEWPSFIKTPSPKDEGPGFRQEAERRLGRPLKASEVDAYWRRETLAYVAENPGTFLRTTGKRLAVLFNRFEIPDNYSLYVMEELSWVLRLPLATFGWVIGPLGLVGLLLGLREVRRLAWLYLVFATYVASIAVFFVFDRYRLPMIPPLVLFSALAIVELWRRLRGRELRAFAGWALVLVLALVLVRLPIERFMNVGHFDSSAAHYNIAMMYLKHGRCDLALPELQRVPVERPELENSYGLHEMIGQCQMQVGDRQGALESFARAAELRREKGARPPGS